MNKFKKEFSDIDEDDYDYDDDVFVEESEQDPLDESSNQSKTTIDIKILFETIILFTFCCIVTVPMVESPVQVTNNIDECEHRGIDVKESEEMSRFVEEGCGCLMKCSSLFTEEAIQQMRWNCMELSHLELDIFVMGQLMCTTFDSHDVRLGSGHRPQERQRTGSSFQFKGRKVKV